SHARADKHRTGLYAGGAVDRKYCPRGGIAVRRPREGRALSRLRNQDLVEHLNSASSQARRQCDRWHARPKAEVLCWFSCSRLELWQVLSSVSHRPVRLPRWCRTQPWLAVRCCCAW